MSIWTILGTLTVKPVELLFDVVCSLLTRFSVSPGAAIMCMSLFFCLIATPLRPRKKPDCRQEWIRLALGWLVRHYVHSAYRYIMRHPDLGFYCWSVSLAITTGITLKNIAHSEASDWVLLWIAAGSLMVCLLQFVLGRLIGRWQNETINCGQGMFQKNTAMAIWVSYMYLHPVASIGAGCYVLWQNIVNSIEISRHGEN